MSHKMSSVFERSVIVNLELGATVFQLHTKMLAGGNYLLKWEPRPHASTFESSSCEKLYTLRYETICLSSDEM